MITQELSARLKKRTLYGLAWSGIGQGGAYFLHFVSLAVMTRILSPDIFGLVGLATVITLILKDVSDLGLGVALIQNGDLSENDLDSAFWLNLLLSFFCCLLLWFSADFLSVLLSNSELSSVLKVLSFLIPINSFVMVPYAMLQKELKFKQISIRDIIGELVFGIVGISLALLGFGIWSMVYAVAAQWTSRAIMILISWPWFPKFKFNISSLRKLVQFGLMATGVTLFERIMANIDYFIVGRYLGATALGYYTLAFQLAILPTQRITGIVQRVLFPSFSIIKKDLFLLKKSFLSLIEILTLIFLPVSAFILMHSSEVVTTLYSPSWAPAIRIVEVFSIAALWYGLDIGQAFYFAIGKPNIPLILLLARAVLFVLFAIVFGISHDIFGIALCILFAVIITSIIGIIVIGKILKTSFYEVLSVIKFSIGLTFVISMISLFIKYILIKGDVGSLQMLIVLLIANVTLYGGIVIHRYNDKLPLKIILSQTYTNFSSLLKHKATADSREK